MKESFKILFHENGDPLDPRCIERFIWAFPNSYRKVVETIIEKSERLDQSVFKFLVARLMPSFGMTRNPKFAFHGVKIDKKGAVSDPKHVIDACWKEVGKKMIRLKDYINEKACGLRNRVIADLPPASKDYAIRECSQLFEKLHGVAVENSEVGSVGASKVLFATFPEIALPVDNMEWKFVFKDMTYREVLFTMAKEINEWERKSKKHLDALDPYPMATLPGIYNVMAMSIREKEKLSALKKAI